ncbi:hypothetical protein [Roseobacter litoralis]|uniref:hypothetical protein n=1 Tax=Roseobacter litoralis TaxID=42443 RepID=UPI0024937A88|nr:hypothetical protein [Roseobacter litoralis]
MTEMHHCLPRLNQSERNRYRDYSDRLHDVWYLDLSKMVLRAILENGLLLCREAKTVFSDSSEPRQKFDAKFNQVRACFTYSSAASLLEKTPSGGNSHIENFGDISVCLSPSLARSLGAMPCHYYATGVDARNEASPDVKTRISENQYGQIRHLTQARDVLHILAILEARGRELEDTKVKKRLPTQQQVGSLFNGLLNASADRSSALQDAAEKVPAETAKAILDLFNFRRFPMLNLAWKVDGILDSLQVVDSTYRKSELEYFRQSEWRIPLAHHSNVILSCLDVDFDPFERRNRSEIAETQIARDDIDNILAHRFGHEVKLTETRDYWLLWGSKYPTASSMKYTSFAEMVERIYCPSQWQSEVSSVVCEVWKARRNPGKAPAVVSWEQMRS